MRFFSFLLVGLIAFPAFSAWQLDNQHSSLSFISIKKGDVGEVHQFTQLKGGVSEQGKIEFIVDLSSVNTKIDIRNERLKKYLFEINLFPKATFSAQLDKSVFEKIAAGTSKVLTLSGQLDLHGQKQAIKVDVLIAKLSNSALVVSSLQPILIKAKDYHLVAGISKLRELANLPSISNVVPVSFVLSFNK